MRDGLTAEQEELVNARIRDGLHELLRQHPEYLEFGVETVAEIFRAGVISGVDVAIKVAP